jgi:hypothetical protein
MAASARERRLNAVFVISGLILVLIAVVGGAAIADIGPFEDRPQPCSAYSFDREAWKDTENPGRSGATDSGEASPAQLQADQLVRCHLLVGLSHQEVLEKLGAPELDPGAHPHTARLFGYDIGIARDTFLLERETLYVRFGNGDRVQRAYQRD